MISTVVWFVDSLPKEKTRLRGSVNPKGFGFVCDRYHQRCQDDVGKFEKNETIMGLEE